MARNRAGSRDKNAGYRSVNPTRAPRSAFDMSFSHKTTAYPSRLLPVYTQEVMPGDTISCSPRVFLRQLSSVFPVMDGIRCEMQFFFAPTRLLHDNWARLQGERMNPDDHTDYTVPVVQAGPGGFAKHSLFDYLGCPTEIPNIEVSAYPARACGLIFQEWYRDQNLMDTVTQPTGDGPDAASDPAYKLQWRLKVKDRFFGALPFAQKGEAVKIPIGTTAPVVPHPSQVPNWDTPVDSGRTMWAQTASGSYFVPDWTTNAQPIGFGQQTGLEVDLTQATANTVNALREAISLQQLFERDARSGTRYSEGIYAAFGVRMPDLRYRPELISSGTIDIMSTEIPNYNPDSTNSNTEEYYQGRVGSSMKGVGQLRPWSYSADEWGFIIGFLTIRSEVSYSQGIPPHLLRQTRIDHYTPELALIGEESIPTAEIYVDGTGWTDRSALTGDFLPWGFTPRYESYRHRINQISGELRSYNLDTNSEFGRLDRWHYGLDFNARPVLDENYIADDPNPILRNVLHSVVPPFIVDLAFRQRAVRPMPKTATPGLLRF